MELCLPALEAKPAKVDLRELHTKAEAPAWLAKPKAAPKAAPKQLAPSPLVPSPPLRAAQRPTVLPPEADPRHVQYVVVNSK